MSLTDSQLVMVAGRKFQFTEGRRSYTGVKSLSTGKWNRRLQEMAQQHALYQARHKTQGHQLWERRSQQLVRDLPEYKGFAEIAAESWPWNSRDEAATELFNSWRQSPGHWSVVNGRCDIWGVAMSKGTNGIWYGCGIVGFAR